MKVDLQKDFLAGKTSYKPKTRDGYITYKFDEKATILYHIFLTFSCNNDNPGPYQYCVLLSSFNSLFQLDDTADIITYKLYTNRIF